MHRSGDTLLFSATDLSKFLSCAQLTQLDRLTALGLQPKPPKYDDPALQALFDRGLEHEANYLTALRNQGLDVLEPQNAGVGVTADDWYRSASDTLEAMQTGADVIYQGVLFDQPWLGKPDFLRRVNEPSLLGDWSYEVVDTKLAREAKAGAVLQITLYSDLLSRVQGRDPEWMELALGGPSTPVERFRFADFSAFFRHVQAQFRDTIDTAPDSPPFAPEPCDHCRICAWHSRCRGERRAADHLSLVAGISRSQRSALRDRSIDTLADLAQTPLPFEPGLDGVGRVAAERIREQARIQFEAREAGDLRHEFLEPIVEGQGFCALPAPSPGDLFFDFEGDAHYQSEGLEYLFGWVDTDENYTGLRALHREAERSQFTIFVDFVMARREQYPGMHIYHYAPYEPIALKRLMGRHAIREDEVDDLLRSGVFVDLFRVVRQGLRASVESYSIKKMEPHFGFERSVDLRTATAALKNFEAWLAQGGGSAPPGGLLAEIEGYNKDDCVSTLRLRDWLEELRSDLGRRNGQEVPRFVRAAADADEDEPELVTRADAAAATLLEGVPLDPSKRTAEQQGRWLLAQLLNWHRREKKSFWWQYFTWRDMSDEELTEDRSALGGLDYVGEVDHVRRSTIHRFQFPGQEHSFKVDDVPHDPVTGSSAGTIVAIDEINRTLDLRKGNTENYEPARGLVPYENIRDIVLRNSLVGLGELTIEYGFGDSHPNRAGLDLLLRRPPRVGQADEEPLTTPDESSLDACIRLVRSLDRSVLPVQGPPGAGKTYTGARAILALLKDGRKVGICATSHKVIGNLLDEVCTAARASGIPVQGIQKAKEEARCDSLEIELGDNAAVRDRLAEGEMFLAAGTAWLWSREDMRDSVDVLFIDEAGQFSLANALAITPAAGSLVLLGDPRQLEQPQQGAHPPGSDVSALDHVLGEEATIPSDRGLFLPKTWRLPPEITAFTSEMFYRGRLGHAPGVEKQTVADGSSLTGAGLRWIPVEHTGNQNESAEEVRAISRLVGELLEVQPEWTDRDGTVERIGLLDILIIAPYNAQVAALQAALPDGARVGTVDKFQGQEAPIVLYSLTSSSREDAPRGMDFLYSPNRLNVATSRAKCLAVVVGAPALFAPECRSPKEMRLANAFCRLKEMVEG